MILRIFELIKTLYLRMHSLEWQARKAGVSIGKNNFITSHFWSSEPYLITVGSNCQLTAGTQLLTHGGGGAIRSSHPKFDCFGKVVLGDYVYLGHGTLVMPGVTIGNNVLVAAGSVVTKSIPSNCVVAGNPARYICSKEEYYERNKKYNLDSKGLSKEAKKELLLSLPEEKFIHKTMVKMP